MPVGLWSGHEKPMSMNENWEAWDEPRVVSRDVSPSAFMEELCSAAGGYSKFFWSLMFHYFGWYVSIIAVPAVFLDHHKCEVRLPYLAWMLYMACIFAMLAMAVLLELSMVQRLGLLKAGELLNVFTERRWQIPLLGTILWKLDSYTDVVFIFIARDCNSGLWWASLATFMFGVVFGQLLFNTCFACTDCDRELPSSFGFVLLDFKLVNAAVKHVLPFDPDASHLPVAKPVTLRTTSHLVGMEKVVGDIAQVAIQILFLKSSKESHGFVVFSILCGIANGVMSFGKVLRECAQDEWSAQSQVQSLQLGNASFGNAILPGAQLSSISSSVLAQAMPSSSASSSGLPHSRHSPSIPDWEVAPDSWASSKPAEPSRREPAPDLL